MTSQQALLLYASTVQLPPTRTSSSRSMCSSSAERALCFFGFRFEDVLDRALEQARNAERERQAGIVFATLQRVDCLPRYAQLIRQIRLRPAQLSPQRRQHVLH